MGNASGRNDEAGSSGSKIGEEEEYMEYAHSGSSYQGHQFTDSNMHLHSPPPSACPASYHSPLMFPPQIPAIPSQRPDEVMDIQGDETGQKRTESMPADRKLTVPRIRELLQSSGNDFNAMKANPSGAFPHQLPVHGKMKNVFNNLDLKEHVPGNANSNASDGEGPSSPETTYDNASFVAEDFEEKVPELPPLIQKTPLDHPSSSGDCSSESLESPITAVLNHLYVQKGCSTTGQSVVALSSTNRFRTKYVTVVLYKSVRKTK